MAPRSARSADPTVAECRPYRRGGELAVGVVGESAGRVAVGDGENLVEIAVAVGLGALLDETARRVVGVARRDTVGRRADELVRVVEREGGGVVLRRTRSVRPTIVRRTRIAGAEDLLLEHVAGFVVGVALDRITSIVLDREKLALPVVLVRLADAVRGAGDYLAGLRVFVDHRSVGADLPTEVLARELTVLGVLVFDGRAVDDLSREASPGVVCVRHLRAEARSGLRKASEPVVGAVLLRDNLSLAVLRDARKTVAVGIVCVGGRETAFLLLNEAAEVVVLVNLLRLAARVLREAVPLVVGEALNLAVAIVGVGEPTELVVFARNATVFAAVPLGDDFLEET